MSEKQGYQNAKRKGIMELLIWIARRLLTIHRFFECQGCPHYEPARSDIKHGNQI